MFDAVEDLNVKTLLVGQVVGLLVYWLRKKLKYRLPPGPFALPIVGNLLQFKTKMLHEEFFEWSKTYGPVISVYLGPTLAVVVNDKKSAMEVLVQKGSDFAGRISLPSLDVFSLNGKDIGFSQYGPRWKLHRQISSKALRQYMKGNALEERIHNVLSVVFNEMEMETGPFEPDKYIKLIIGNILVGVCFGGTYQYDTHAITKLLNLTDRMYDIIGGGGPLEDMVPGLKYIWETSKMQFMRKGMNEIISSFFAVEYRDHVKTFDENNIRDFTDMLILARQEAENDPDEKHLEKLMDIHIVMTLFDIFIAGFQTSRATLRFAVLYMIAYPEIQTKVQDEIYRVVPPGEFPQLCHRPQLSYTEAVLHESMRLATVGPTAIPHKTTCDSSVAGYDVPKDTMVIINIWALHHDAAAWERVDEFLPERFLDADGKMGPKPESWLPFSAGRRVCLGETVAKPELHLIFAALMQRFAWRAPDGVKVELSPIGSSFVLSPREYDFMIEKRNLKRN